MAKKKKSSKKKAPEYTLEEVQVLADDINDQNLFDEIIDLDEAEDVGEAVETLKETIVDDGECQIFDTDDLTDESFALLEKIGCPAGSEGSTEKPEPEPEKADKKAKKKKAADKKKAEKEKEKKKKAADKKKADKKKAEKKEKKPPYTRTISIANAFKKVGTYDVDEVALEANNLFVENGGKDSMHQSTYFTKKLMVFAKHFDLADQI